MKRGCYFCSEHSPCAPKLDASWHSRDVMQSCRKSAACLLPRNHPADIRMRLHRLLRLDDNKSTVS